jgi:alpha-glucosidase (family GH31 glycosyl hydrolase)
MNGFACLLIFLQWYDYDNYRKYSGPGEVSIDTDIAKIPVFIRGGSIFAIRTRVRRSSALMKNDPYTLVIAVDAKVKGDCQSKNICSSTGFFFVC